MSKKILVLCMAALMAVMAMVAGCGSDKKAADGEKVLKVGTNADFAPFEFQGADPNAYEGFDMDLIRAVGKEMGYKVEINNLAFDGLIPSLEAGNIDVIISGMTINDERKQKVLFSDPYYKSGLSIMVAKDNNSIKTFNDLKGKKVAVQIGTTSATEVKKIEGVQAKELNSSADTFIELAAKGVDAVINDRPVNDRYIVESKNGNVKVLPDLLTAEDYGIAINKKDTELQTKINAALKKLKENGEYDKIYTKWFGDKK
ncbi:MAG: basic amino acid ABC transporter substrate-binding protein [Anaerovibrio sp.]|uniref:basic amino acid ABC transporter substrate-binding protein n=1 Tax=Anaerovibrio sp. TaxID=1872532 RepID=UPI0025BA66D9|nr:basic amino acid ABC transporter substrate-binding protein [Anaerovibrio sp.]MBE6098605.1 basic amino acid ABC transporter substrate-binding protein [Anaerovibrio sp.]MBQ3853848.1 basic amino acid ABC transporter substrate-binding protein [Anaerovibrio sp.]